MKSLLEKLSKKIEYIYDESISPEVKRFQLTAGYALIASLLMVIVFIFAGLDSHTVILGFGAEILVCCMTFMAIRTKEYKLYTVIICFFSTLIIYPVMYFITGAIFEGIPFYLSMGIIISFFLLDGYLLYINIALQILCDGFILIYSYKHFDMISVYCNGESFKDATSFSLLFAAAFPAFIIYYERHIFKKSSLKINESNKSLNSARIGKSELLSEMTNEIRNPMNSIFGMIEVILKEDLSTEAREQAEIIKRASSELLSIINNILVYSKLDSGKMELLNVRYNFREMINDVIKSVVKELASEDAKFNVFIDHDIPTYLYGDELRIKQVFRYLLFNSIHQTPNGRISLEIHGETNHDNNSVTLKCKILESGRGLTESELSAVYGAYYKYDTRQRSDFKGMGLELFICREILKLMGGPLKIESIAEVGMAISFEFNNYIIVEEPLTQLTDSIERKVLIYLGNNEQQRIWMPLMEDFKLNPFYATSPSTFRLSMEERKYSHIFVYDEDYDAIKSIIENAECREITYVVTDYNHMYGDFDTCRIVRKPLYCLNIADILNNEWKKEEFSRKDENKKIIYPGARVLVVDDNMVNLKVISSVLENFMINADTASSGERALSILDKEKYDLILLDQLMPELSGTETLHRLRKSESINKDIPVLCITAEFGGDVRERLIAEGFQDYIAKPLKEFHLDRLLRLYIPKDLHVTDESSIKISPDKSVNHREDNKVNEIKDDNKDNNKSVNNTGEKQNSDAEVDPLTFDINLGISLVGGSKEVYLSILNTYYSEGLRKLKEIPEIDLTTNLSLYTTNVHALKSSSASVGCTGVSAMFKALEMAGKSSDMVYIDNNSGKALDAFEKILEMVKEYLIKENSFESDEENIEEYSEEVELKVEVIEELRNALANVNLKKCEEIIEELSGVNYGSEFNKQIKEIKKKYEQFDYGSVKSLINEFIDMINIVS